MLIVFMGVLTASSCMKYKDAYDQSRVDAQESANVMSNAERIFGTIDPKQDWNSIVSGSVTVTANADLDDVVKVQVLTEAPFLNPEARVLCEASTRKGESVTMHYDAPNAYERLVAACVDSKGHYYIQVFKTGQELVTFQSTTRSNRRAAANEAPTFTNIKLGAPRKSFNAMRQAQGDQCNIANKAYTEWANAGWEQELMWEMADGQTFDNGWKLDSQKGMGHVYRDLGGFADGEKENVEAIIKDCLYKYDKTDWNGKKNNLKVIKQSKYFMMDNNYVRTDGKTPVTLIPIQSYSTEFKNNNIYYYYFRDEDVPAGMDEVDYIKQLPKYKAISCSRIETTADMNSGAIYRRQEFLLPYYKNAPQQGDNEASAIFPKGYKIGFVNMKHPTNSFNASSNTSGCVYGDGRLNYAINHIEGHFLSAMDKSLGGQVKDGMTWTDPRMAMFTANGKTYICLEDGADCNFCDLVMEIGGGTEQLEEEPEVEAAAYTMCFEDRPAQADYDLNDVVLRSIRINATTISLALIATGANDDVYIHGADGWQWNDQEVHEIFMIDPDDSGNRFANTVVGGTKRTAMTAYVKVATGVTIPQYLKSIYIENRSTGKTIRMPQKGEPPYAIIVPEDFQYPMENQSITTVYKDFIKWAQDINSSENWYKFEDANKIFPSLFR